jgi:membrane-bound lytic murein transglycosylase D
MPEETIVDVFIQSYLARKRDWLQAVLEKIPRYRSAIAAQLSALGLPRELMFLPAVESGFQAKATSPRGAAGLWQLMRNTASPYGLVMDQWVDERRDFLKSGEASLKKLSTDFRYFGNWCTALAAYNCGSTLMARLVRQNGTSDYWTLRRKGTLPAETAAFVPQFLALAKILSYPGRYGLDVPWTPAVAWASIPVARTVDLRVLSRESGVPLETLTAGNVELTMAYTPPASYGYTLKVPMEFRDAVESALAGSSLPMVDFSIHLIKEGDTLYGIARANGVTIDMLTEFNPGVKPLALKIGSRLLVPMPGTAKVGAGKDAESRPMPGTAKVDQRAGTASPQGGSG